MFRGIFKRKRKVKRDKYLTMMLISNPTKKAKTIKVHKYIRYPIYAVIISVIVVVIMTVTYIANLEMEVAKKDQNIQVTSMENKSIKKENEELKQENEIRYNELITVTNQMDILKENVEQISEHKEEIDEKLNSTEKTTKEQVGEPIELDSTKVANSKELSYASSDFNRDFDEFEIGLNDLEKDIKDLAEQLSIEQIIYDKINEKVDEVIPYWESYPSILPVNGRVTSPFGWRRNPFTKRSSEFHKGVDLYAYYGTSVKATGEGKVIAAEYDRSYGYMIVIDHGYGISTRYAHNSKLLVDKGDVVKRGDIIAKSGNSGRSTGPHVHYEVMENGKQQNPLDYLYEGEE
ncbi:MAG: peptidoglycan DD-metalloendopeptidase family protein [Eubacteriales bacterium]